MFKYFILIFLMANSSFAAKKLAIKLVAEVDQKIITSRDVEANQIVEKLMSSQEPKLNFNFDTDEFRISMDQLIIEYMVYNEASSFGIAKVTDEEIETTYKNIKQKINDSAPIKGRWQSLAISDTQFKDIVTRRMRASRLIKYKTESSQAQVTDEEAKEYFDKNRLKFGTMGFENFKPSIKKFISKRSSEERLREWFDVLKKKHKLKNLI